MLKLKKGFSSKKTSSSIRINRINMLKVSNRFPLPGNRNSWSRNSSLQRDFSFQKQLVQPKRFQKQLIQPKKGFAKQVVPKQSSPAQRAHNKLRFGSLWNKSKPLFGTFSNPLFNRMGKRDFHTITKPHDKEFNKALEAIKAVSPKSEYLTYKTFEDVHRVEVRPLVRNMVQILEVDQSLLQSLEGDSAKPRRDDVERLSLNTQKSFLSQSLDNMLPRDVLSLKVDYTDILQLTERALREQDSGLLLSCAATVRDIGLEGIGDVPLGSFSKSEKEGYLELLEDYRQARASRSQLKKLRYLDRVKTQVLPRLKDDVAYFQALSMLLSYVHFEADAIDVRLPFTPTQFWLIDKQHQARLRDTVKFVLVDWILQTGGKDSGVKIKCWMGVNSNNESTGVYIVDCMGTNSMGPNRDFIYQDKGVVTGALADKDSRGIAFSAFEEMQPAVKRMLGKYISKDDVVINIGHSLGASVAAHSYINFVEHGYENTYLLGFNGGAVSHEISPVVQQHALDHAMLLVNQGDPVPYGGKYLLPGVHRTYSFEHEGTIGPWNPMYGVTKDPIHHGDMQHLAAMYFGVPPKYQAKFTGQLEGGLMRKIGGWMAENIPSIYDIIITSVLKPDPSERAKNMLSYITRSDAPKSSPFRRESKPEISEDSDKDEKI